MGYTPPPPPSRELIEVTCIDDMDRRFIEAIRPVTIVHGIRRKAEPERPKPPNTLEIIQQAQVGAYILAALFVSAIVAIADLAGVF